MWEITITCRDATRLRLSERRDPVPLEGDIFETADTGCIARMGWPQSKRKDQVDAAAGAFNKLIAATAFDSSFSWVAEHEIALTLRHLPGEFLISRARNNLVSQFLRTSSTHLMFIDADLAFEAASVGRMLDLDSKC